MSFIQGPIRRYRKVKHVVNCLMFIITIIIHVAVTNITLISLLQ